MPPRFPDVCSVDPSNIDTVLRSLREVLADSSRWTRGALARTVLNDAVVPLSDRALKWSLTGAIAPALMDLLGPRATQSDWQRLYEHAVHALWSALPNDHPRTSRLVTDLDGFNDYRGTDHEDVVDLIDRALASLD
jgi:hypothetical protein